MAFYKQKLDRHTGYNYKTNMLTYDIVSMDFGFFLRECSKQYFFIDGQKFSRKDIDRVPEIIERLRSNYTQQTIECLDKTIDGKIAELMLRAESPFCFNIRLETY